MTEKRLLVIVPAWNEASSIQGVITEVRSTLPFADVLVVDDGSSDDTAVLARRAGARVLLLPFNLGVGAAMRLGYRYARDHGYDRAVQIDADGQHDPTYVPALLAKLDDGADLVIGARFAGAGDYTVRGPRRWAMVLLSIVLSRFARTRLTDTTSGLRACGRPLIELFAKRYPAEYLGDTVESLTLATRAGHRITQVPVAMRQRSGGKPSHSSLKAAVYLGRGSMALCLALIRS